MSHHIRPTIERLLQGLACAPTSAVGEYFTPDWVNHDPTLPGLQGLEGAARLVGLWRTGFSNLKVEIEDVLGDHEKVACRFRISGTHTGPVMGIPASGKPVSVLATGIFRLVDGKMAENWVVFDALGLLQQIGAAPMPG